MFCAKCGSQMADDAAFCPACGAKNVEIGQKQPLPTNHQLSRKLHLKTSTKHNSHIRKYSRNIVLFRNLIREKTDRH